MFRTFLSITSFYVLNLISIPCVNAQSVFLSSLDRGNATNAFSSALASNIDTLIIDEIGRSWQFDPTTIAGARNKVIIIDEGVEINATSGVYGKGDALFKFIDCSNIQILGNRNLICMNKDEYITGEWRHGFSFLGSEMMVLRNVQIKDTGGDGVYIAGSQKNIKSNDIVIDGIISSNNKRQGMSVISVANLKVTNSIFEKTIGTLPEAGVDFEPNRKDEELVNIFFENCEFKNNGHAGIVLALGKLTSDSEPVSITFKNCILRENHREENRYIASEIIFGANSINPVKGDVLFEKCTVKKSQWGLFYSRKTSDAYMVIFKECAAVNLSLNGTYPPIYLEVPNYKSGSYDLGGYKFENLLISFSADLPLLSIRGSKLNTLNSVSAISGRILTNKKLNSTNKESKIEYINYNPEKNTNFKLDIIEVETGLNNANNK
tara:strand:- start:106269 stop:107573 length:1305 start_codon:yes stop_codon:yes gene_type:complete